MNTGKACIFDLCEAVCSNIEPLWFMSDDVEQYFNAWRGVFSSMKTRKLLSI